VPPKTEQHRAQTEPFYRTSAEYMASIVAVSSTKKARQLGWDARATWPLTEMHPQSI
jgi:hypothetical protein